MRVTTESIVRMADGHRAYVAAVDTLNSKYMVSDLDANRMIRFADEDEIMGIVEIPKGDRI